MASKMTVQEQKAARYEEIAAIIAPLLDEQKEITEYFRGLPRGSHEIGNLNVSIQANRTFDAKRFEAEYPEELNPEFYKKSVDSASIKNGFAPVELDAFYNTGAPKVVIKPRA